MLLAMLRDRPVEVLGRVEVGHVTRMVPLPQMGGHPGVEEKAKDLGAGSV